MNIEYHRLNTFWSKENLQIGDDKFSFELNLKIKLLLFYCSWTLGIDMTLVPLVSFLKTTSLARQFQFHCQLRIFNLKF